MAVTSWEAEVITSLKALALGQGSQAVGSPQSLVNGIAITTAEDIVGVNNDRRTIYLHNHSDTDTLIINFGSDATLTSAIYRIQPEQTLIESGAIVTLRISAIASSGTINYSYLEVL